MYKNRVITLVFLAGLLLAACAGPTPQITPEVEEEPIIIGSSAHLSGWMAVYDGPPRLGVLLAIKHINETGGIMGRPVEFIELDGQTDAAVLGRVTQQLIDEGADVLVAPCDFDFGAAAAQVAQENGIVAISTCASSPMYGSEALGDMQFTLSMWNTTMCAVASEFAYNEMGWRTAYVVTETSTEYHTSLSDLFVKAFEHLGGEIINVDTYVQGDLDASAQVQRYMALPEEPDVLFISSSMPDVGTIVRQFRAAGVETPILGGDSYDNEEFYAAVGDELAHDIYMSTHSWVGDDSADPKMGEFIELWTEEYGNPPEYAYNTMGWDVVYAFKAGIEAAGTTEGDALAKALEDMVIPGLSGAIDWSTAEEGHYPYKEAFILKVQDGEVSFLYKTMPEWLPPFK